MSNAATVTDYTKLENAGNFSDTDKQALHTKFLEGGAYSLPYLIELSDGVTTLRFINDVQGVIYNEETYEASSFSMTPSDTGSSSLEIEVITNNLISLIDGITGLAGSKLSAVIKGVKLESGTLLILRTWVKGWGTASWDGKTMKIDFDSDERMEMTFPALIWNGYNNRGNS